MKPSNTIFVSPKYIEEKEHQLADLSKKVERLQEQLNEANEVIKKYAQPIEVVIEKDECVKITKREPFCDTILAKNYLEKWGVK